MGDDHQLDSMLYAINRETGEEFAVGGIIETPKLAPGGVVDCEAPIKSFGEDIETEITINLKAITKKTIY